MDKELKEFVKEMHSKNTVKKTDQIIRRFTEWIRKENGHKFVIEELGPELLNNYIGNYLLAARETDGSEYEPDTPTTI